MTSNYEFLAMLHRELKPRGYLEIGVRYGDSLRLAQCPAIGVDPVPPAVHLPPHHSFYGMTSDQFFSEVWTPHSQVNFPMDLVYIDGMHLYEFALRDFLNVARYANPNTVVVFDDTHPYSQSIATREQPPGDWTGDVWKTMEVIKAVPGLFSWAEVDVSPTGAFVVYGITWDSVEVFTDSVRAGGLDREPFQAVPVPQDIVDRSHTISPEAVIDRILDTRNGQ